MRVLFVAAGPPTLAASRTRVFQYLPALHMAGVDAHAIQFFPYQMLGFLERKGTPRFAAQAFTALRAAWLATIADRFDLVVWQRVLLPPKLLSLVRRQSRRLIFDVDDALYAPSPETVDPSAQIKNARRFDRTAAVSDAVIASTAAIAAHARRVQPVTFQLLSPVDTERFKPTPRRQTRSPVIGWIGSPSTGVYLQPLLPTLSDLIRRRSVRVVLVGSDLSNLPPGIEQRPWSLRREVRYLAGMDIGLMPLDGNEWSHAKGGYKTLQYHAAGATSVASAVGAACEIIQHGENGLLVHEPEAWTSTLTRLIDDQRLREELAQRARQTVVERHSLRASAPRLIGVLQTVLAGST